MPIDVKEVLTVLSDESQEGHTELKGAVDKMVNDAVSALQSTNVDLKEEKKKLQEILDGMPGQDDIEKMKQLQERLDSSEDARLVAEGKVDEVIAARTERMRTQLEDRINVLQTETDRMSDENKTLKNDYDNYRVDNVLRKAAVKAEVITEAMDDVTVRAASVFRMEDGKVVGKDENGEYILNKDGEKITPLEFINGLKETAPHFWPPSKGGGLNGGDGSTEDSMIDAANSGDTGSFIEKRRAQIAERNKTQQ